MSNSWAPGERSRIAVLGTLVIGALLYPLRQHLRPAGTPKVDGFPLSYYPMFSKRRRQTAKVVYAVGVAADGTRHRLPYQLLGSGGFNQVRHQLNRTVRQDRVDEYAARVAARLAGQPGNAELVAVEIRRGQFDLDSCLLNRRVEGKETVLAHAPLAPAARSDQGIG